VNSIAAEQGLNRPVGKISEDSIQKLPSIDTKTTLNDIPLVILNELEFWETELFKIVEKVNEKTGKRPDQAKGDAKYDRLA